MNSLFCPHPGMRGMTAAGFTFKGHLSAEVEGGASNAWVVESKLFVRRSTHRPPRAAVGGAIPAKAAPPPG